MAVRLRRLLTAAAILAMTVGLTVFSTITFNRGFDREATAGPVPRALDQVAAADLNRVITNLQDHLKEQPKDSAGWATLGLAYVEQARLTADPSYYPKAKGVLDRSLTTKPKDNDQALTGLAALNAARHDFGTALKDADQALVINPYSTRAHAVRVDALVELGRYKDGLQAVRRADAARPGIPIFTRYAYVLELTGKPDQARKVLEQATSADRKDVAYIATQLGELAWNRGDLTKAAKHYADALRADADYFPAIDGRAKVRAARGDFKGALADRIALATRVPLPSHVVALGELYESRGRHIEAKAQYAVTKAWEALARTNGVAVDLESALIGIEHGDRREALKAARAEWARRRSIHVADALAWALHVNGKDREALGYARMAAATGFRDARFLYHRGMIEKSLGKDADARRSLAAALRLNPHFSVLHAPQARRALEALK